MPFVAPIVAQESPENDPPGVRLRKDCKIQKRTRAGTGVNIVKIQYQSSRLECIFIHKKVTETNAKQVRYNEIAL